MISKLIKAGQPRSSRCSPTPFAAEAADIPRARTTRPRRVRWCPTTTGPASTPASTAATAGARRIARPSRRFRQAEGQADRRHARLQLADRRDRLRSRRRLELVGRQGQRPLAARSTCETRKRLARHVPWPPRLRLRSLAAVRHRRAALTATSSASNAPALGCRPPTTAARLDRRRRPRIRLPRQLDRQARISLRRSRQVRLLARPAAVRLRTTSASRPTSFAPA